VSPRSRLFAFASSALLLLPACHDSVPPTQPEVPDAAAGLAETPLAAAVGSWSPRAPMPTPRTGHVANTALSAEGEWILYVFGGLDWEESDAALSTVEAYNVATDSWTTKAPSPYERARMNGIGRIGQRLYLPGGGFETGNGFERWAGLMVYDTRQDRWIQEADMPQASSEGVAGVIGGKLYVLTGFDNVYEDGVPCSDCPFSPTQYTRQLFRYNPATDTWTRRRASPHFHVRGAAGVIGGKFYVAGGLERTSAGSFVSRRLDIYDPVTNQWSSGADMPEPRSSITGAVVGGKLFIIGGAAGEVAAYDPLTNRWTAKAPVPTIHSHSAADKIFLEGRPRILTVGGIGGTGSELEMYTP
jgi:N-acetylneuraminic acid mutarotase